MNPILQLMALEIPKEDLERMYCDEKLSLKEVGDMYSVSQKPIRRLMKTYGIQIRSILESASVLKNRDAPYRRPSKHELLELYFVRGLGTTTIAKMYGVCGEAIRKCLLSYFGKTRSNSEAQALRKKREWQSREYRSDTMDIMNSDEYKARMSEVKTGHHDMTEAGKRSCREKQKNKWADPDYRNRLVKVTKKGLKIRPNRPEQRVMDIIKKHGLPYVYVGDGSVVIYGYCPDFINCDGEKKIIEVFGRAFHDESCTFRDSIPDYATEDGRKTMFSKLGYDTLILWDDELDSEEKILNRIKEFENK